MVKYDSDIQGIPLSLSSNKTSEVLATSTNVQDYWAWFDMLSEILKFTTK